MRRLYGLQARLAGRLRAGDPERGDVPGWVLVTLMTAGLVTVLWAVAGDRLVDLFVNALDAVSGPGG
ncbi:MAG: hypothetical protein GEV10_11975 [Streptosporangiales bacterium]|nr:hypothetical protein [Streptosporangiales bacterium]